jgi:predicted amidohydrolase YtcJ
VEQVDPMLGLYASVSRQDSSGKPRGGWMADQRLSAIQALRGFTQDAAYAGFAERDVGSLEIGKRADFVVLSADVLQVPAAGLLKTHVLGTYVDGKPVYTAAAE